MKTYVLILSAVFPAYHPRKGEDTGFKEKFLSGEKKHTIRSNPKLWMKRIDEVIAAKEGDRMIIIHFTSFRYK